MNGAADNAKERPSGSRRWAFRAAAVLLGLSPFLVAEATLRVTGWQPTIPLTDPFVDFHSVRRLFVADDDKQQMVTAENRLEHFRPESFDIEKGANKYRIVCIGGSTVQGRPYAIEMSFTTWLQLTLEAADSSRQWEVINCGGVSYASYRLVAIVEEMLDYQPDPIILLHRPQRIPGRPELCPYQEYSPIRLSLLRQTKSAERSAIPFTN